MPTHPPAREPGQPDDAAQPRDVRALPLARTEDYFSLRSFMLTSETVEAGTVVAASLAAEGKRPLEIWQACAKAILCAIPEDARTIDVVVAVGAAAAACMRIAELQAQPKETQ